MSRSGYTYDCEHLALYRGAVRQAIRGKRGQRLLRDIVSALDTMPVKKLGTSSFAKGEHVCVLGAVAQARGVDLTDLEPDAEGDVRNDLVASRLDVAESLAAEVQYMNDEFLWGVDEGVRWRHMRAWALDKLQPNAQGDAQ